VQCELSQLLYSISVLEITLRSKLFSIVAVRFASFDAISNLYLIFADDETDKRRYPRRDLILTGLLPASEDRAGGQAREQTLWIADLNRE
jgi:hypothetical protein